MEKQEDVAAATHRQSKIAWRILEGLLLLQLRCAVVVVVAHKPRGSAQGFVKPTCPVRKALSSTHIRKESVSMSIQDGSPSTSQRPAKECKIHKPCNAAAAVGASSASGRDRCTKKAFLMCLMCSFILMVDKKDVLPETLYGKNLHHQVDEFEFEFSINSK